MSPTIALLDSISLLRLGCMLGPMKRVRKPEPELPPISISSGSSPGTPTNHGSTITSKSPTIPKSLPQLRHFPRKALPFILVKKQGADITLPSPAHALPPVANDVPTSMPEHMSPQPSTIPKLLPQLPHHPGKAPPFILAKKPPAPVPGTSSTKKPSGATKRNQSK